MKRSVSLIRTLPRRDIPARRLATLLFLGTLGLLGIRLLSGPAAHTAKPSAPRPNDAPASTVSPFAEMRPRPGDHMTLPRIGFRWVFDLTGAKPQAVSQASMVPPFLARIDSTRGSRQDGTRFVLHLVGPGGQPEITKESTEPNMRLNLKKDFPTGDCEWWVEAVVSGQPPLVSPRERFILSP
jgi:hypothetical protein